MFHAAPAEIPPGSRSRTGRANPAWEATIIEHLDAIAGWFTSLGIHPVLGAFVAGAFVALVVRSRRPAALVEGMAAAGLATGGSREPGLFSTSTVALQHAGTSLSIDGRTVPIEPATMRDLVAHIRTGHTIDAIKLVRKATGLGLTESKQLVDALASSPLMR